MYKDKKTKRSKKANGLTRTTAEPSMNGRPKHGAAAVERNRHGNERWSMKATKLEIRLLESTIVTKETVKGKDMKPNNTLLTYHSST